MIQPPRSIRSEGGSDASVGRKAQLMAYARAVGIGYAAAFIAFGAVGGLVKEVDKRGWIGGDRRLSAWLADHRTSLANDVTEIGSRLADTEGIVAVAAVVCLVLLCLGVSRSALLIVTALALELLLFLAVNSIVDRARPDVVRLGSTPSTGSFPSGHSAATVALYGSLALIAHHRFSARHRAVAYVWLLPVVLGAWVAVSRAYRGMHYPSDVIVGLLLGVTCAAIALRAAAPPLTEVRSSLVQSGRTST